MFGTNDASWLDEDGDEDKDVDYDKEDSLLTFKDHVGWLLSSL